MTEDGNELKERFIYPTNPTLRKAYFAVIRAVLEHKRVIFQPVTLIEAIREHMEWPDDSNFTLINNKTGGAVPAGTHYKKAKNLLKSLGGNFTKFRGVGLEVIVYRLDGVRVSRFSELEELCALDKYLSEIVATSQKLDPEQPWQDEYILNPTYQVSNEISQIDADIADRQEKVVELRAKHDKTRHQGTFRGSVLSEQEVLDVVATTRGTGMLSTTQDDLSSDQPEVLSAADEDTSVTEVSDKPG